MRELSEENIAANDLKTGKKILVIKGNPPYRGMSANKGKWIDDLLKKGYLAKDEPFWWLYFLMLVPSLLIYASAIKFLRSKGPIDLLASQKVRAATLVTLAAVPLLFTCVFLLLMYLL